MILKQFKIGEIVAIRYEISGTFGGMESDWRAAVYQGKGVDGKHLAASFPTMKHRSFSPELVDDDDIFPAGEFWEGLNEMILMQMKA